MCYSYIKQRQDGLVVKVSTSHAVGCSFAPGRVIPKSIIEMVQIVSCLACMG